MGRSLHKILYVEDEPDIQEVACLSLGLADDLVVEACSSGQEALDKVNAFGPDLILLDVMMPDMDGPTTLGKLREIPAAETVPVVFMTAKVQRDEVERFLALGAAGIIPKPFDPLTLADQVKDIWRQSHG
jgi:CheY-like chemotaxis protein